jgi:hypothetical protein
LSHQSPSFNKEKLESTFNKFDSKLNFDLDIIDQIFTDIGWLTHIVIPLFKEKFIILWKNGFLANKSGKIVLTKLGDHLFTLGVYNDYINSITYKANFWKRNNVKITDNV